MEIGIQILDSGLQPLGFFDRGFSDLQFSDFLDGVGSGQFKIKTQSNMLELLQPGNIIEIIDIEDSDRTIWRGFVRPFTVGCEESLILLSHIKYRLDFSILETAGTFTNIQDMLSLLETKGFDTILNMPDKTFDGIEYRIGMKWFDVLEEIRKATDYDWTFDGKTITFGRVGTDREDIQFWGEAQETQCGDSGGAYYINNIQSTFVEQYDKVIAYNPDVGFAIAGDGDIEVSVDSNATTIADLQVVADEKLKLGSDRRVITFDVPNLGATNINVGDSVFAEASCGSDIITIADNVRVLKKEVILQDCEFVTKIFVSESKVTLNDNFNIGIATNSRISNLETR